MSLTNSAGTHRGALRPVFDQLRPAFASLLVHSLFVNLLALAAPIFVLQVYDRVVFYAGLSTLTALVIGMGFALAFDFALRMSRGRLLQRLAVRIDVDLSRRLYGKLDSLPLMALESRPAAVWTTLFRDIDLIRNTLAGPPAVLLADLPFVVLFIVVIAIIAPPLTWLLLLLTVAFVIVAGLSGRLADAAGTAERGALMARDGMLAELVAGRGVAKALGAGEALRGKWEERQSATIAQGVIRGGRTDLFSNLSHLLSVATTVCLTAWGALAILDQTMTVGSLIAANMLANRIVAPLTQLVQGWRGLVACRISMQRLGESFALDDERAAAGVSLPRPRGELAAEAVVFSFPGAQHPTIDNLSLRIPAHGVTAVVGPNGSGKTTLLKLLLGLYRPAEGRVLLDGADTAQFSRAELRKWVGYVPQETTLFAGTIRDNLLIGRPDAEDRDLIAAAEKAGLHRLVIDLPNGYGTEVGESGGRLSGGFRQRIAIARALVGDPPILLMDEPSASLDRQGEDKLRETLLELGRDHTVLVVTHSPALLPHCQTIIALNAGRLLVAGPAQDVLTRLTAGNARAAQQKTAP